MSMAVLKPSRLALTNGHFRSSIGANAIECSTKSSVPKVSLGLVEDTGHVLVFLDVAGGDQLGADRIGQLADATLHLVAGQVGEAELRAFIEEFLR